MPPRFHPPYAGGTDLGVRVPDPWLVMLIRLEEEKRVKLEAMYLRLELLQREINRLIQERDALGGQISSVVKDTLKRKEVNIDLASVRPIFENFQLKGLEVPEKSLTRSEREQKFQ